MDTTPRKDKSMNSEELMEKGQRFSELAAKAAAVALLKAGSETVKIGGNTTEANTVVTMALISTIFAVIKTMTVRHTKGFDRELLAAVVAEVEDRLKIIEGEEHDLLKRAAEMTDEELFAELEEAGVSIDG